MAKKPAKTRGAVEGRQPAQIVVLGMHRSGTSALTGALASMGAYVGEEEALTAKNWENPLGFFERRDLRTICDGVLHGSGADWWKVARFDPDRVPLSVSSVWGKKMQELTARLSETANASPAWAIKEPRLCLLFPVLRSYLVEPRIVLTVRHPMEVARSLRRRNGFPISAGLALWEAYNVAALSGLGGIDPVIVRYDELINSTDTTLKDLSGELAARGVSGLDAKAGAKAIMSSLRREGGDGAGAAKLITDAQQMLWDVLVSGDIKGKAVRLSDGALEVLLDFEADETSRQQTLQDLKVARSKLKADETAAEQFKEGQKTQRQNEAQIAALNEKVAAGQKNQAKLNATIDDLNQKLTVLSESVATQEATRKALSRELDKFRADADVRAREFGNLKAKTDALNERVSELKEAVVSREATNKALIAELDKCRAEADMRSREVGKLQASRADLEAKLLAANDKIADAEKARLKFEAVIEALREQTKDHLVRLEFLKKSEADVEKLQLQLKDAGTEAEALREQLSSLSSENAEISETLATVRAERSELSARAAQAEEEIALLRDALARSEAERARRTRGFVWLNKRQPALPETHAGHSARGHTALKSRDEPREVAAQKAEIDDLKRRLALIEASRSGVTATPVVPPRMPHKGRTILLSPMSAPAASVKWWRERHLRRQIALVRDSGLFDSNAYLAASPDVAAQGVDPVRHYLEFGWREGRQPGPHFDAAAYFAANSDLDPAQVNPVLHYLQHGRAEGRPLRLPGTESEASPPLKAIPAQKPVQVLAGQRQRLTRSVYGRKLSAIGDAQPNPALAKAIAESESQIEKKFRAARSDESPLVSVIMPTWNRAAVIGDAIRTVIEQEYVNWELLVCDDASEDNTKSVVESFNDARIRYLPLPKAGAAAARNAGLANARGDLFAYLDSDNYWHPAFLLVMVRALGHHPGRSAAYSDFIDFHQTRDGSVRIRSARRPNFNHEHLLKKNFIDLNTFVHTRELYDLFGGFNAALTRRQDYDLILKYTWLRDPVRVACILALYQRNDDLHQITTSMREDTSCIPLIEGAVSSYLKHGLPLAKKLPVRKVTILSWDLSRNHFSKPFALAEALSEDYDVQLVAFRFFEESFPPLKNVKPNFETVYIDGTDFPDFFAAMRRALDAITGDLIYVVKPRLPSLGIALLANASKGTPIVLEINDLETVVASPTSEDRHEEVCFSEADLAGRELLNPYSDLWSQLMDPVAKQLPVLLTHNQGIDQHFDRRCLYMRNLKDDAVYDPDNYEREEVRAELGFAPVDRVILFGGLLRKHKGIFELVELVERLSDPRYKLLFVGSRITPDQDKLIKQYAGRVMVLPPQDREAMARINLAADLVILWLDPDVPASHYQMPYKATDAFAMGPAIIANDISDLGRLAAQGYLRSVPFGDWEGMAAAVRDVFDKPDQTRLIRDAARRLYQRQFSYPAARSVFALAAERALKGRAGALPVSMEFATRFNAFFRTAAGSDSDFVELDPSAQPLADAQLINVVKVDDLSGLEWADDDGIAVIMPCIDTARGLKTAELLHQRAGTPARYFVVEDTKRQGFIPTLNEAASRLDVKYVVYLAEDAYPGLDWLKLARERLDETGKGLLAFNCGKWHGRIAAFGMVRKAWAQKVYPGAILYPGYRSHKADNEITAIARVSDQFVYEPDAVLVEYDPEKPFREEGGATHGSWEDDKLLFDMRFRGSFDARFSWAQMLPFKSEYLNQSKLLKSVAPDSRSGGDDEIVVLDVAQLSDFDLADPDGIVIVMPSINVEKARDAARLLQKRAGTRATYLIVEDTRRQGFIPTLNQTAARLKVKYIVYLAEDAFPGVDWLKIARQRMDETGAGLLAFNCGKWRGRIAAFGMVRKTWIDSVYHGPVFHEAYKAHKADNEITVIARAQRTFVYAADSVLVEYDPQKVFVDKVKRDRTIFRMRYRKGFDGMATMAFVHDHAKEYFVDMNAPPEVLEPEENTDSAASVSEDTFIFYRIIGNDLHPRHKLGQSYENLKFILEHESDFRGCKKKFIVNRIVDKGTERKIIDLLHAYNADYVVLPFIPDEYQATCLSVDQFKPGLLASKEFDEFESVKQARVLASVYRDKNAYVMNNNGARNHALGDGDGQAKWIMPWDGNCFITDQAWNDIRSGISDDPDKKYFIVPMARMLRNEDLLNGSDIPKPVEEPQIIFRHDAAETFNEQFLYGRRPKVELLWRLGVPGKWDEYRDDKWDPARPERSADADHVGYAGWVARLFSGSAEQEESSADGDLNRGLARLKAIISTLRHTDAMCAGADASCLVSMDAEALDQEFDSLRRKRNSAVTTRLVAAADEALLRGPFSVRDKTTLPPSGDIQDYWHPAPYWWPDPSKPDGLPYIRKDGERVPGTEMYDPASEKYDRTRLQRVFDDSLSLALAWKFTGDDRYAEHGASILERFFVNPETRMNPHLSYGQVRMGHRKNLGAPTGIIEMKDLYFYLDAVRILRNSGAVTDEMNAQFQSWLRAYLEWLLSSDQGKAEKIAINNHGTCYDLQVAAIAAFIGDTDQLYTTLARAKSRIAQQFAPDGSQPDELKRKTTAHYCCFNMQSWINLTDLSTKWGVNLWAYTSPKGASLRGGASWLLSYMGKPWPFEQIDAFDADRFLPILFAAAPHIDVSAVSGEVPKAIHDVKPVFFPHDGIRPFWNLGRPGNQKIISAQDQSLSLSQADRSLVGAPHPE